MKSFWSLLLIVGLVVAGCGEKSTETAPSEGPPLPVKKTTKRALPPPLPDDTAERPPIKRPDKAPPFKPVTFDPQKYATMPTPERSALVADLGVKAGNEVANADAAKAFGQMYRLESTPAVRAEILNELGWLEEPAALDVVLASFDENPPADVLLAATDAADSLLSDIADAAPAGAYEAIVRALDPRYPQQIREAAITALEDLKDQRAIAVLQALQQDKEPAIREQAADALDMLKE